MVLFLFSVVSVEESNMFNERIIQKWIYEPIRADYIRNQRS
jgi:hypothetical protein